MDFCWLVHFFYFIKNLNVRNIQGSYFRKIYTFWKTKWWDPVVIGGKSPEYTSKKYLKLELCNHFNQGKTKYFFYIVQLILKQKVRHTKIDY